jgi:hypothetical protein
MSTDEQIGNLLFDKLGNAPHRISYEIKTNDKLVEISYILGDRIFEAAHCGWVMLTVAIPDGRGWIRNSRTDFIMRDMRFKSISLIIDNGNPVPEDNYIEIYNMLNKLFDDIGGINNDTKGQVDATITGTIQTGVSRFEC